MGRSLLRNVGTGPIQEVVVKHRGQSSEIISLKRMPRVTQAAGLLLVLAFLSNFVAMATRATEPAGFALCFAVTALALLLIFQP